MQEELTITAEAAEAVAAEVEGPLSAGAAAGTGAGPDSVRGAGEGAVGLNADAGEVVAPQAEGEAATPAKKAKVMMEGENGG